MPLSFWPRGRGRAATASGSGAMGGLIKQADDEAKGLWLEVPGSDAGWHFVTRGRNPAVPAVANAQATARIAGAGSAYLELTLAADLAAWLGANGNRVRLLQEQATQGSDAVPGVDGVSASATYGINLIGTVFTVTRDDVGAAGNEWVLVGRDRGSSEVTMVMFGSTGCLILRLSSDDYDLVTAPIRVSFGSRSDTAAFFDEPVNPRLIIDNSAGRAVADFAATWNDVSTNDDARGGSVEVVSAEVVTSAGVAGTTIGDAGLGGAIGGQNTNNYANAAAQQFRANSGPNMVVLIASAGTTAAQVESSPVAGFTVTVAAGRGSLAMMDRNFRSDFTGGVDAVPEVPAVPDENPSFTIADDGLTMTLRSHFAGSRNPMTLAQTLITIRAAQYTNDDGTTRGFAGAASSGSLTDTLPAAVASTAFTGGVNAAPPVPREGLSVVVDETGESLTVAYDATDPFSAIEAAAPDTVSADLRYGTDGTGLPEAPGSTRAFTHLADLLFTGTPQEQRPQASEAQAQALRKGLDAATLSNDVDMTPRRTAQAIRAYYPEITLQIWDAPNSDGGGAAENSAQYANTTIGQGRPVLFPNAAEGRYRVIEVPDGYRVTSLVGEAGQLVNTGAVRFVAAQGSDGNRLIVGPLNRNGRDAERMLVTVEVE